MTEREKTSEELETGHSLEECLKLLDGQLTDEDRKIVLKLIGDMEEKDLETLRLLMALARKPVVREMIRAGLGSNMTMDTPLMREIEKELQKNPTDGKLLDMPPVDPDEPDTGEWR